MSAKADRLGVYFLDVGQGDCTFILNGRGEGVLFDCRDELVAREFVREHGVRHLRAVVASHLDVDHIGGMHAFLRWFLAQPGYEVDVVYIGHDRPDVSTTARDLLCALLRWNDEGRLALGRPEREGRPKTVWESGGTRVEIVLPRYAAQLADRLAGGERPNPSSAVLRVTRAGTTILIGGDAPLGSWERLEPELVPAKVFRAPHHGGDIGKGTPEWTTSTLYERVSADEVVVSVGTHNAYQHPSPEHVGAMGLHPRRLLCTQLTPRCHADPSKLRPGFSTRGAEVSLPYRHLLRQNREVPCAGTVVAWIGSDGSLTVLPPRGGWHDEFVKLVERPLCLAAHAS